MSFLKRSKNLLQILGYAALLILLAVLQVSFFALLPRPFCYLNLVFPTAFFITIILNYRLGLWFAFFIGLILDLFSSMIFGAQTIALMLAVVSINILFNNFFTNRSFYSLIFLGFLGNLIYDAVFLIFIFFLFVFGMGNNLGAILTLLNFYNLLWQIFFSVVILAILFFIFCTRGTSASGGNFLSKKLKSVFYWR